MKNLSAETKIKFSFGWSKFAHKEVERNWYKDSFSYLKILPQNILRGNKIGLDVGCGSGADMINISRYGAKIIGVDNSDSIRITQENIKNFRNLSLIKADIYNLPFKEEKFDFVYSFGVLHHLLDPENGFRNLVSKIKKGGCVIIYVYEDFSERSVPERILLKIVNSFRLVTTKMPSSILFLFCIVLSPLVFLSCCIPYQILKRIAVTKRLAEKIPFRHTMRLYCIVSDLYDRFSPPIENRYKKTDIQKWFDNVNLKDVNIINYRGWVAWGKKL